MVSLLQAFQRGLTVGTASGQASLYISGGASTSPVSLSISMAVAEVPSICNSSKQTSPLKRRLPLAAVSRLSPS
jgi:hypothetical protein